MNGIYSGKRIFSYVVLAIVIVVIIGLSTFTFVSHMG
jgi:heme/copper-type cytochrome/quinol oxidase subunit 1